LGEGGGGGKGGLSVELPTLPLHVPIV